jgi:hypothetical protein
MAPCIVCMSAAAAAHKATTHSPLPSIEQRCCFAGKAAFHMHVIRAGGGVPVDQNNPILWVHRHAISAPAGRGCDGVDAMGGSSNNMMVMMMMQQ